MGSQRAWLIKIGSGRLYNPRPALISQRITNVLAIVVLMSSFPVLPLPFSVLMIMFAVHSVRSPSRLRAKNREEFSMPGSFLPLKKYSWHISVGPKKGILYYLQDQTSKWKDQLLLFAAQEARLSKAKFQSWRSI